MKYEKSCGAVIYRENNTVVEYLLILNKKGDVKGHWGFAKGHVESGESEAQTATREIMEETGLEVKLDTGFRAVSHYVPKPGIEKDAVYFAAQISDDKITLQETEISDYEWCDFDTAIEKLTYDADRSILRAVKKYLTDKI